MPGNGGFPPIKTIKKDNNKKMDTKERFYKQKKKNIVNISEILESVKKPMIDLNKDKINIIETL